MIAVSSFKPFSKSSEIAENQMKAKESWERVFSKIIYLCDRPEPELASGKTEFVTGHNFPIIRALVDVCASQRDWACIINADIVVSFRLKLVEMELKRKKAMSAISKRFQIPENEVVDYGLDWFAAIPALWAKIANRIPGVFRIGHPIWDTWMLAAFGTIGSIDQCYDATPSKIIFHPKHLDREQKCPIPVPTDPMMKVIKLPTHTINLLTLDNSKYHFLQ